MALFKCKEERDFEKVIALIGNCIMNDMIKCKASNAMKEICIGAAVSASLHSFGKFKNIDSIKAFYRNGVFETCEKKDAEIIANLFDEISDLCLEGITVLRLMREDFNIRKEDINMHIGVLTALVAMLRLNPQETSMFMGDGTLFDAAIKIVNGECGLQSDFAKEVLTIADITATAYNL